MGKALLLIVLGSGLVLTKQLYNTTLSEERTSKDQRAYQEEVIAREIAASAFNVGMGEIRSFGEDVQAGTRELNGASNAGRAGSYTTGRFQGGTYTVKAELTSAHSVRVIATGAFGDAEYTMHDEYRVFVMVAREGGVVDVSFLESQAGYCSSVYYQAYTMDMPEGHEPASVMLFAPDNRERSTSRPARMIWVEPGTQLNFYIAVDQNCSTRPSGNMNECQARAFARGNTLSMGDFDYTHTALLVESGDLDQAVENIWGLVEQKPGVRNVWRIGWEDIHDTSWDRPNSDDPAESLQALKSEGYDGLGWPDVDSWGYRALRDYGGRPDFSDQVIEVSVISPNDASYAATVAAYHAQQAACGEIEDDFPEEDSGSTPDPAPDPDSNPEPEPETEPEPEEEPDINDEYNDYACDCTRNNRRSSKYPVLHRPPGNEANEKLHCLPNSSTRTHLRNHNDVVLTCQL